jgi:multidrug efflux system outer membrane protein
VNRVLLTLVPAAGAMLAGCDLAPKYVRPAGAVPAALPHGGIYPPAASDAPDVTRIGWRDFFTDERLRRVIEQGLYNNRDLRISAANVLAARAQYRIQRADQLPTINATGTATYTNEVFAGAGALTDIHFYNLTAGFSAFEIDLFGRVRNLSKAALEQYFATSEAQRSTRITLISEIANAWLTLAADQDQLLISRENLRSLEQSRSLTEAQFRIGTASELEARQADTDYQSGRNDIAVLLTQIARDKNALDLLVGAPVPAELLPGNLPQMGATLAQLPAGISSTVLLRRPDVLQAEHQLLSENANIGAARAAMFPTISLTAVVGTISTALSGLFSGGTFTYTVEPSISQTIFDRGRRRANVRLAEANKQAAVANYEKAIQTAFREVADALAERGTIDEQMSAQTQRVGSAQVAARLSDARFRVGVASFLDVLVSQRAAYSAQQDLVTTRLNRSLNLVELYRSLGGGLS